MQILCHHFSLTFCALDKFWILILNWYFLYANNVSTRIFYKFRTAEDGVFVFFRHLWSQPESNQCRNFQVKRLTIFFVVNFSLTLQKLMREWKFWASNHLSKHPRQENLYFKFHQRIGVSNNFQCAIDTNLSLNIKLLYLATNRK